VLAPSRLGQRGGLIAVLVALSALGAALVLSTQARGLGLGFSGEYTFGGGGCPANNHSDPVNILFRGPWANAATSAAQTTWHTTWTNQSGSTQWLWVHTGNNNYDCRAMNYQRASGSGTRYHVRYWWIPASGGDNKKTAASAHHEDFVFPCGHAVDSNGPNGSGFDQGRWEVRSRFINGGHFVDSEYWGNTANFQQCDDDWAGSNGNGVLISIYHETG
jgi:hypothetical protein